MKVVPRKTSNTNAKTGFLPPPIPLERPEPKELEKGEYLTLKLRSVPDNDNSPEYELTVPYFRSGTTEEWFKFVSALRKVIDGQNLTQGPARYAMARRLLVGDALAQFNNVAGDLGNETVAHFDDCIRSCTTYVLPKHALQTQKRFMRRILRKPKDMKVREYFARYHEMNDYLPQFAPFGVNQKLSEDELKEHAEFSIPVAWHKQMILHGFNPVDHTLIDFIEFCERLEFAEDISESTHKQAGQRANGGQTDRTYRKGSQENANKRQRRYYDTPRDGKYYCDYHKKQNSHTTDQCKVIKAQAERMAAAHANLNINNNRKGRFQNKTWERKKSDQDELNAMVENKITEMLSKAAKKRKDPPQKNSRDDDFDLDNFNYDNFNNLNISDSDDE